MDGTKFVILGGGMVAGYAAKELVELGMGSGQLTIVSAEAALPYERPPLSKGFLAGRDTEESILINPEAFYRDHGIALRLGNRVSSVDGAARKLNLEGGGALPFESLILATGASVRTLDVPGSRLDNIRYLRSLADSKAIRERAGAAHKAVVIGGGFIGMEVASVLAQNGVETTMVLSEDRIWKKFFTPEMSQSFENYFAEHGVRFVKQAAIKAFTGDGRVAAVELRDGPSVPCEFVVAGIGVRPEIGFLEGSGIATGDGVMVDELLETNIRGIFAAGDIANYPDLLFNKRRRVEHWDNAVEQGRHCARTLMGRRAPFRHVPYFFSDVFDLSYEFWGDPAGAERVVHRGDVPGHSFSAWWLRGESVVAAFVMRRPDEERDAAPRWIESRRRVSADPLADAAQPVAAAAE
jgi:NADPH-dependent 2,4-dienoyl-CoA reductase/sulfur reductase-like enzyme